MMHEHSLYLSQRGRLRDSCRTCLSKQQITILEHPATSSGEQEVFGFAHSGAVCGTAQLSFTSGWWAAGLWPHDTVQCSVGLQARLLRRGGSVRVVLVPSGSLLRKDKSILSIKSCAMWTHAFGPVNLRQGKWTRLCLMDTHPDPSLLQKCGIPSCSLLDTRNTSETEGDETDLSDGTELLHNVLNWECEL